MVMNRSVIETLSFDLESCHLVFILKLAMKLLGPHGLRVWAWRIHDGCQPSFAAFEGGVVVEVVCVFWTCRKLQG